MVKCIDDIDVVCALYGDEFGVDGVYPGCYFHSFLSTLPFIFSSPHYSEDNLNEVWKQMLNSSWCGLLAALSLLLEARSLLFIKT